VGSTGSRGKLQVTRVSNGYRLVAPGSNEMQEMVILALESGAKGAKRRSYTLLEIETEGVV
jgi:hypothetical protein